MEARKLLCMLLAVSPVVLMVGIGVHSRTYLDPFEWPSTIEDHLRTKAYIPLVIETQNYLQGQSLADPSEAPRLAAKWVDGAKSGALKPLTATTLDENSSVGNKAKVIGVNYLLARTLLRVADDDIRAGNYDRAVKNLTLASDSLNCLKYSNFLTLYRVTLAQHSVLTRVKSVYDKVSAEAKRELAMSMELMRTDERLASRLAYHTARLIKSETEEYRQIHALESEPEDSESYGTFFEQPALAKGNGSEVELENIEFASPNLSLEVKQCVTADQRNRLMIQKIMSLSPHSVS